MIIPTGGGGSMAGSKRALWGIAVLFVVALGLPWGPVRADDASCQDFRAKIVDMDTKSSRLPGYIQLRAELSSLYGKLCSTSSPAQAQEYWYSLDGKKLGPAGSERPGKAAYATTEEIGKACATSTNPSMCALVRGAFSMCANPPDADTKAGCNILGAYPTSGEAQPQPGQAPPLPPVNVALDGQTFALPADCYNVLAGVVEDPPANRLKPTATLRYKILDSERLARLRDACPDFLAPTAPRRARPLACLRRSARRPRRT
jgi:hypothetical protein